MKPAVSVGSVTADKTKHLVICLLQNKSFSITILLMVKKNNGKCVRHQICKVNSCSLIKTVRLTPQGELAMDLLPRL